jgi:hypothetical protein
MRSGGRELHTLRVPALPLPATGSWSFKLPVTRPNNCKWPSRRAHHSWHMHR